MQLKLPTLAATLAAAALCAICAPAAHADDAADAKKSALAYMDAMIANDKAKMNENFKGTATEKQAGELMADLFGAYKGFEAACVKKFGPDAMKDKGNDMDPKALRAELEKSEIAVDGDKATVKKDGQADGMQLVKDGGTWKVSSFTGNPMATGMMMGFLKPVETVMKEMTTEVEAGKYKSIDEVKAAGQQKMQALMGGGAGGNKPSTQPAAE